jgi:hypothetical protein
MMSDVTSETIDPFNELPDDTGDVGSTSVIEEDTLETDVDSGVVESEKPAEPEAVDEDDLVTVEADKSEDMVESVSIDEADELVSVEADDYKEPEVLRQTQAEVMQSQIMKIVHSSRRVEPVSSRRKTALSVIDGLRDFVICETGRMMTDGEADAFIEGLIKKSNLNTLSD